MIGRTNTVLEPAYGPPITQQVFDVGGRTGKYDGGSTVMATNVERCHVEAYCNGGSVRVGDLKRGAVSSVDAGGTFSSGGVDLSASGVLTLTLNGGTAEKDFDVYIRATASKIVYF